MTSAPVVRLDSAHTKAPARKKGIGLTETERQLLLKELAEIMAELDELHDRAAAIAARVKGSSSGRLAG
jgi:hypothetical protein